MNPTEPDQHEHYYACVVCKDTDGLMAVLKDAARRGVRAALSPQEQPKQAETHDASPELETILGLQRFFGALHPSDLETTASLQAWKNRAVEIEKRKLLKKLKQAGTVENGFMLPLEALDAELSEKNE